MLDLHLLQEVVEAPHPDVPEQDVGGLEDRHHRAGIEHSVVDHLAAQGSGLTGTEARAEAKDQGVAVLDEVLLRRQEAIGDLGDEFILRQLTAGLEAGGLGQQTTARYVIKDAHGDTLTSGS